MLMKFVFALSKPEINFLLVKVLPMICLKLFIVTYGGLIAFPHFVVHITFLLLLMMLVEGFGYIGSRKRGKLLVFYRNLLTW